MNKALKLQIIKPVDITWKLFAEILYLLQNQTRFIANRTIQLMWEFDGYSSDYKEVFNKFPKDKEILKTVDGKDVTLSGYVYDELKDKHQLYSANASQTQQKSIKKWKNDSLDIKKGKKSIPEFGAVPLDLHNKSIDVEKKDKDYFCTLKLLNRTASKEFGLSSTSVQTLVATKDKSTKSILDRLITKEYKMGGSQIVKHKNKWFLHISYSFDKESITDLNEDNIVGVDMGIIYPVYMAINNSLERGKIEGGEIEQFRNKVEKRRNSILNQGKYCGDGRIGHGRKTRLKPTEKLSDKVSNFRKTTNFKYARYVVDFAVKNNCGTIQMEDLSGISKDDSFLKKWSYYDLQMKIINKASEYGINVVKVNRAYTSQRCSKCGFIHSNNRPKGEKKQSYFKCVNCEFETNADYNAAKNISLKDIDKIIKEQLELQERVSKNSMKYADL